MKKMVVLSIVMGLAGTVFADTPTITVYGEEVVVTATRAEKRIGDVPVSVSVVTKDEMEQRSRVTFVDEALRYEAGACQKRTKFGDTMSRVTLRGFSGGQRTLVLLDGIPLNDACNGGTYLGDLPIGNVERIEVAKGPFSSLYGGEAMGGVINVITKTPEKEGIEFKSSASAYNTYQHILNYGNKMGRFSFFINLEKKSSEGDRTDLVTKSVNSGTSATKVTGWEKTTDSKGITTYLIGDKGKNYWDQLQYSGKFTYSLNPASKLSLSYTGGEHEYGYCDPQSYLKDVLGKPYDSGKVELNGDGTMTISQNDFLSTWGRSKPDIYGLAYESLIGVVALKGNLSLNCRDKFYVAPQTDATYHGGAGKLTKSPGNTLVVDIQGDMPLMNAHLITIGLNYRADSVESKDYKISNWKDESSLTGTINPTSAAEGKGRLMAIYSQSEVSLIENLKLFLGARCDTWKKYDASCVDSTNPTRYADKESTAFSPKLGVLYKCQRGSLPEFEKGLYKLDGIRASWGKAFRPPTIYELYKTWKSSTGKTYAGNPELIPETTQSWEIGIDQHLSKIAISATYFQSRIDDLIYSNWITGTYSVKQNAGCGKISGFEMEGKMKIASHLDAFANYTLQDTEITSNPADPKTVGKKFEHVPEKMYNLGLSFHRNAFDASCIYHFVDKLYATSDNIDVVTGVYGAYDTVETVDMKIGYALKENLRLSLAMDNLFDRKYYQSYKSPGRTVTFEVGCKY
ncbi:MAG: TonB-dependent receptor [Candidatus Desantisbacteria bacterium]